jgi:hypothetical protein
MKATLELWQVFTLAIAIVVPLAGAFFGMVWRLFAQFQRRFDEKLTGLTNESKMWRKLERDLLELRAELPVAYVRREDYIRGQTVIEAKLDAISSEVRVVQIQGAKHEQY